MLVWIINPYGNIPGEDWRPYRTTLIADALVAQGHQVVSWISNFQHRSKTKRAESWQKIEVNPDFHIQVVPASPYYAHISLDRVKYERSFAKNLRDFVLQHNEYPDVIILGEPALCLSDIILDIVKKNDTLLVIDVIDLWPELFSLVLPKPLAFLDKILFAPLYARRKHLIKKADGLVAVAKDYLALVQHLNPNVPAEVVYWGLDIALAQPKVGQVYENLYLQNLKKEQADIWVVYAGTLGENYDIPTLVEAAKLLAENSPQVKFIIAGDGPLKELVKKNAEIYKNIYYLGSVKPDDLSLLYQQCDMALSTYKGRSTVSMPIKAYDYLAGGLPLVNSLGRNLGELVTEHQVGMSYEAENANSLASAIQHLASDANARQQMKINAKQLALEFDADRQYQKMVRLVEQLYAEKYGKGN